MAEQFKSIDQRLQYVGLAEDIIEEARVQLMLKFRFLDRALWRMELIKQTNGLDYPLATDGGQIYFDPEREVSRFRQSFEEVVRDYLHMIMHCIFRQPFDRAHKSVEAWSLTCDIIVEATIIDLTSTRFPSEEDKARQEVIDMLTLKVGNLLPARLYEFLEVLVKTPSGAEYEGFSRSDLNEWHQLFERDDHSAWPSLSCSHGDNFDENKNEDVQQDDENPDIQADGMQFQSLDDIPDQPFAKSTSVNAEEFSEEDAGLRDDDSDSPSATKELLTDTKEPNDTENNDNRDLDEESATDDPNNIPNNKDSDSGNDKACEDTQTDDDAWKDISKELEMNLSTFSKEWGDAAGSLLANLQIANRRKYNYSDFLRKFMSISEQIILNLDEFDYTYYTFGLDLYGNMPFIEPLEYKETETLRDFVIAIDTSESVKGELVRKFIEHTFAILKESQTSRVRVNIHVIQVDSKVQNDLKITNLDDVDKLMEGFTIRGFGGTDFRPAFDHVEMLRRRGELSELKGMIYFTDGYGQFPEKVPDYDVAFVFVDDDVREIPPVPPWAMKVVLDEHEINNM